MQTDVGITQPEQPVPRLPARVTPATDPGRHAEERRELEIAASGSATAMARWSRPRITPEAYRRPAAPRTMRRVAEALRVERTGPGGAVARVTLARPERRNAFDASRS